MSLNQEYPPLVGKGHLLTKLPKSFPTEICDDLTLGIDIGVGSCGLALVHKTGTGKPTYKGLEHFPGRIAFLGVRTFDLPETKEKSGVKLKNPERRGARLLRRTVARRAQRMRAVRQLLKEEGVLPPDYSVKSEVWKREHEKAIPLDWRVAGLDRKLKTEEWAAALIHFAKHRGFRSARKGDLAGKGKEGGTLDSTKRNHEALSEYRSVGEMFAKDQRFAERKRNREKSYTAVVLRADLVDEVATLFERQRELGNPHAAPEFEARFVKEMQRQRPLQDPIKGLGTCPFTGELRGAKNAPSFELSRALQRLNTLALRGANGWEIAFPAFAAGRVDGYRRFRETFGTAQKVTWKNLREMFAVPEDLAFADMFAPPAKKKARKPAEEKAPKTPAQLESEDFVNRGSTGCAYATSIFRKLLGSAWEEVTRDGWEALDEAAFALSFYEVVEDVDSENTILGQVRKRCAAHPALVEAITRDLRGEGKSVLAGFSGSVSVSSRVSRELIPHLCEGLVYSDAMAKAGYVHTDTNFNLASITNPVVQSVIRETMKQIVHLIDETGKIPGAINIELGRDLGKSIKERNEIDSGIRDRTDERKVHRKEAAKILGKDAEDVSEEELLRYELYDSQGGLCPYSGDTLPSGRDLFGAALQIDHILPRSRSQDNSYDNRVLVFARENQNKGSRTPYEFFSGLGGTRWDNFQTIVASMRGLRPRKRRNLLNTTFAENEAEFLARNLNDTRYVGRVVAAFLQTLYTIAGEKRPTEKNSRRRIYVRPGALTSLVRKAWGLENLKKDLSGKRIGDKHHAVDALVCACVGEGQSQFITALSKAWGDMERLHNYSLVPRQLPPPWEDFRNTVVAALDKMNVSRREDRGGRGALHNDTVYGRDESGTVWKRTSLIAMDGGKTARFTKPEDVERIRGARVGDGKNPNNNWFRDALREWIEKGSPVDSPPLNPNGKPILKVFMEHSTKTVRKIPRGWVSNAPGSIVRCDVFSTVSKGKTIYHVLPIYVHQLKEVDAPQIAEILAVEGGSPPLPHRFEFSLWKNSRFFVSLKRKKGAERASEIKGDYAGFDIDSNRIDYYIPDDKGYRIGTEKKPKLPRVTIGRDIAAFNKLYVDRLGRVYPIPKEKRTWRGKVCI